MSNASRGKQTRGSKLFDISGKVALITGALADFKKAFVAEDRRGELEP